MIRKQDIQRAIALFKEWDHKRLWEKPSTVFINHTSKKAEDSLHTAKALFNLMSDSGLREKVLPGIEYNPIFNNNFSGIKSLCQLFCWKIASNLAYDG